MTTPSLTMANSQDLVCNANPMISTLKVETPKWFTKDHEGAQDCGAYLKCGVPLQVPSGST